MPDVLRDLEATSLEPFQQFIQVVNVREARAPMDEHRFDGFFGSLLRLEAKVFEQRAYGVAAGECEIAPRPVEPFAGIGRGIAFMHHTRPFPLSMPR